MGEKLNEAGTQVHGRSSKERNKGTPTERGPIKLCAGLTTSFHRQDKGMAPHILGMFVCLQCEERTRKGGKIKGGQTGWRAVATK